MCCADLTAQEPATPNGHVCLLTDLPFILAEVENHVFSCIYKTDLHEVFDTPVEFVDFHRALSIHFAL